MIACDSGPGNALLDDFSGWSIDPLEAQAFAYVAMRRLRGLPLTLPTTTGAPRPLTGAVLARP